MNTVKQTIEFVMVEGHLAKSIFNASNLIRFENESVFYLFCRG